MEVPTDNVEDDLGAMPPMDSVDDTPPMPMDDNEIPTDDDSNMDSDYSLDDEQEPLDDVSNDESAMSNDNDELINIINGLSIEDKAAVEKYAKSMQDDSSDGDTMENESFNKRFRDVIDETLNSFLDSSGDDERVGNLPKEYGDMHSPFKSPFK